MKEILFKFNIHQFIDSMPVAMLGFGFFVVFLGFFSQTEIMEKRVGFVQRISFSRS